MQAGTNILVLQDGSCGGFAPAELCPLAGLPADPEVCSTVREVQERLLVFRYDLLIVGGGLATPGNLERLASPPGGAAPPIVVAFAPGSPPLDSLPPGIVQADMSDAGSPEQAARILARAAERARLAVRPLSGSQPTGTLPDLFDRSLDAIVVARRGGPILYANPEAARLRGSTPEELLGQPAPDPGESNLWVPPGGHGDHAGDGTLHVTSCDCTWGGEHALLMILHPVHSAGIAEFGAARLQEVVNQSNESVVITDLDGRIVYVNRGFERVTGYSFDEVRGHNPRVLRGRLEGNADFAEMWRALRAGGTWNGRIINRRKDGTDLIEEATIFPVRDAGGRTINYAAVKLDVTRHVLVEEALRRSESRYELAARGALDGLWEWDLQHDTFFMAPRWKQMIGHDEDELEPRIDEWYGRVHPDDLAHLQAGLTAHLIGDTKHFECEHRLLHKEGGYRWMLARGLAERSESNRPLRIGGSMADITEKKVSEEQLLHQAWHDGLTNLINRATFLERLRQRLTRARWRNAWNFCVLFVDLDRFKAVNDSLGHLAGDDLLVELAGRMRQAVGTSGVIGRIGGDEFAVVVDDYQSRDEPLDLARRLLTLFDLPCSIQGRQFRISASIGVAYAEPVYQDAEHLLRDADAAMYRSKKRGSGRYLVFERSMLDAAQKAVEMEIELRNAIAGNQLRVYYQPIISIRTGRVAGFEALVRWQHPSLGFISPGEFIPLAEESGLIVPIDLWVLGKAAAQVRDWQLEFQRNGGVPLFLSANLSARHFTSGNSFRDIEAILRQTGLPADSLKLEITESLLVEQKESAMPLLRRLQDIGVQISLDDFGTGYSSLSYLHEFPVNTLKIDKSFTMQMVAKDRARNIVRTILILARSLNLPVVAEGVETAQDLAMLRQLECDYAQGYLFSPPVAPGNMRELLATGTEW